MNTKGTKFLAVMAVLAMAFAAFAVVDNGATDGADITYIHGDIIKDQSYTAGKIIVDQDLNVKNGAILAIYGSAEFIVPAGVTLTIDGEGATDGTSSHPGEPSMLLVNKFWNADAKDGAGAVETPLQAGAFITVDGTIVVGEEGIFKFKSSDADADLDNNAGTEKIFDPTNSIVNGTIEVKRGGEAIFNATTVKSSDYSVGYTNLGAKGMKISIIFAEGSFLNVSSSGTLISKIGGYITMEAGSSASIAGIIKDGMSGKDTGISDQLTIEAYDKQTEDKKVAIFGSQIVIRDGGITNVTDVSKFLINVESNVFNAWKDDADNGATPDLQKYKIVEDILNVNMNIRNGETVKIQSTVNDNEETTYYEKKDKLSAEVDIAGSVVIYGDNVIKSGKVIFESGYEYIAEDAVVTLKYNGTTYEVEDGEGAKTTVDPNPKVTTREGAVLFVSGSIKMNAENILMPAYLAPDYAGETPVNPNGAGKLYIDGGVVEITKKATGAIQISDLPFATDGVRGAWYLNDDKDVLTICEIEVAFAAAALDKDIDMIIVTGAGKDRSIEEDAYVISSDLTVWEGLTLAFGEWVIIDDGVTLTIEEDGNVALTTFPYLSAAAASAYIDIKGAILDYNRSIKGFADPFVFNYSVILTEDDEVYELYTSFANAMDIVEAGAEVEIVGDVVIDTTVTIPEGVTVTLAKDKDFEVEIIKCKADDQDGKLINNGIFDTTEGLLKIIDTDDIIKEVADLEKFFVNNNIVVIVYDGVNDSFDTDCDFFPTGFYAEGKIFDEKKDTQYFLSPAAAEANSVFLTYLEVEGDVVADKLTFIAGEDDLKVRVNDFATLTVGELVLSNDCTFLVNINGKFTGAITFNTTAGKSTAVFDEQKAFKMFVDEEDEDDDVTIYTAVLTNYVYDSGDAEKLQLGSLAIISGLVEIRNAAEDNVEINCNEEVIYVAGGATLVIGKDVKMDCKSIDGEYDLVIDGTLVFANTTESVIDEAFLLINGDLEIYGPVKMTNGLMSVKGAIMISEDEDDAAKLTLNNFNMYLGFDLIDYTGAITGAPLTAVNTVAGEIYLENKALLYNYGYDLTGASILTSANIDAKYTDFMVDGVLFATIYTAVANDNSAMDSSILPVDVPGYYLDGQYAYTTGTGSSAIDYYNSWYLDADMTKAAVISENNKKKVGDVDVVFGALESKWVKIMISTEPGITLYVDGLKVEDFDSYQIGTYAVKAVVEPGYQSDVKIMFDGQEIKDGKLVITADLVEDYNDGGDAPKLIATGDVTPIPEPVPGMSITEILLIVLVILIAIMAVIVALRLNRS